MKPFNDQEQKLIRRAIELAENQTSGEIRVCVEKRCKELPLDRAVHCFEKLGLTQTAQRNGVLVYLATEDRKFAIIGDQGINQVVPADFWNTTKETMSDFFKKGLLTDGIISGIHMVGEKLKVYFPRLADDTNELSDDIVYVDEK